MAKVEKCQACGSFYNAGVYSSCPYCTSSAETPSKSHSDETQQVGILGRISSRIRSATFRDSTPAEPINSQEADDLAESAAEPESRYSLSQEEPAADHTPQERTPELHSEEQDSAAPVSLSSLEAEISKSRRTVGKYIYAKDGAVIEPVVGWIVGVCGDNYGRSFPLKSGKNRIGRTHEMDVRLMNDESVSRSCVATIIYDQRGDEFSVLPGESNSLCYLNDHAIYGRELLRGYDYLEFGDSGLNQYLFVPLCGDRFRWEQKKRNTDGTSLENER